MAPPQKCKNHGEKDACDERHDKLMQVEAQMVVYNRLLWANFVAIVAALAKLFHLLPNG